MTIRAILALLLLATLVTACAAAPGAQKAVTIQWLGHSSFLITSAEGVRIVTDPFPAEVGYPLPHPTADVALISHEHFDHNAVSEVRGNPTAIRFGGRSGAATSRGIAFKGIEAQHFPPDEPAAANRGTVTLFTFEVDGIRFCHLGDLGRALTVGQIKAIGPVDALMIPTGGHYTIGPAQADRVIAQLHPKVVIPMHYRTTVTSQGFARLTTLEEFLAGKPNVKRITGDTLTLTKASLPPKTTIYAFMKYSG